MHAPRAGNFGLKCTAIAGLALLAAVDLAAAAGAPKWVTLHYLQGQD